MTEVPDVSLATSSAFVRHAGLVVDHVSPTEVRGHIDTTAEHHTPWGMVHGGVHASAVESAHREGRLDVRAGAVHQGRTGQLWACDITREDGRLVAQGRVRLQNVDAG